eukprot:scaffold63946_cov61-Phaeocystis_antarctica.AAC.1
MAPPYRTYCNTYRPRVPASSVPCVPRAQGSVARRRHYCSYAASRTSLGRAARAAYRVVHHNHRW